MMDMCCNGPNLVRVWQREKEEAPRWRMEAAAIVEELDV